MMKNEAPQKIIIYQMMTRLCGNKIKANIKYGTRREKWCWEI